MKLGWWVRIVFLDLSSVGSLLVGFGVFVGGRFRVCFSLVVLLILFGYCVGKFRIGCLFLWLICSVLECGMNFRCLFGLLWILNSMWVVVGVVWL